MTSSLVAALWCLVPGGWGARGSFSLARTMQRLTPVIEASDRHYSNLIWVVPKTEKICVSVVQKSREKDWLGWVHRFVMAWMAAGLVEYMMI